MKKILILMVVILSFGLSACQEKSSEDVLVVLTSSGYEPYEMIKPDGSLTGFDVELMEALAEVMGIKIEWKDVDFNGIIASLESGQNEVAIAGITPTAERAESVDFSNVYYNSEDGVKNYLVFKNNLSYTSLEDLNGKVIGAQLGTIQAELLEAYAEEYNYTVEFRNSYAQIIQEIRLGSIDAVLVENLVADSILEVNTDFDKSILETSLDQLFGNAIAFTKGSQYVEAFNNALTTLEENGTLNTLIEKWFGGN